MINNHFQNKKASTVDTIKGQLNDMAVEIYYLKASNYTMMFLIYYGT